MTANEIRNGESAVMERGAQDLIDEVARQVSEILGSEMLKEASRSQTAPRPAMTYRVPAAGVRYYLQRPQASPLQRRQAGN